jgi:serine protease Do
MRGLLRIAAIVCLVLFVRVIAGYFDDAGPRRPIPTRPEPPPVRVEPRDAPTPPPQERPPTRAAEPDTTVPSVPGGALLPRVSVNDPIGTIQDDGPLQNDAVGTAVSVDPAGAWLTARHVVEGCRSVHVLVKNEWRTARVAYSDPNSDVSVLRTPVGAAALPLQSAPLRLEQDGYHYGYPGFKPGSVRSQLIGNIRIKRTERGVMEAAQIWAEVERSPNLEGSLGGISGGATLNALGETVGINSLEFPRRARVATVSPDNMRRALARAGVTPPPTPQFRIVNTEWLAIGERVRRADSVARVFCAVQSYGPPRLRR